MLVVNKRYQEPINIEFYVNRVSNLQLSNTEQVEPLKTNKNKFVGLLTNDENNKKIIVKNFYLTGLKRLVHKKYALAEYNNLLVAENLGIKVPCPILFYSNVDRLPTQSTVLMENIENATLLGEIIKQNNGQVEDSVIELIAKMLMELYTVGANHIDLSPDNIFIQKETGDVTIIDWQYANFVKPKSMQQLVMQSTQLIQYLYRFYALDKEQLIKRLCNEFPEHLISAGINHSIAVLQSAHLSKKAKFNV